MKEFQVTCIRKPNRASPHEHITHIGNASDAWMLTRESAIQRIEGQSEKYFTMDAATGKKAYIGVVRVAGRKPFLRTHSDGTWTDNLLALSECTGACAIVA